MSQRNVLCMYERGAAVLQAHASLIGATDVSSSDPIPFRAVCAAQACAFVSSLSPVAPRHTHPPFNGSSTLLPLPLPQQQHLHRIIRPSCLLEPDHSCRCCPPSSLPPLSRAVDALPLTHWMSPPLDQGSFFGLDFLQPVRLRSVSVDVGHTFQRALTVQVLHSLGDAWMTLQSSPHVTYLNSKKDSGSSEGSEGSEGARHYALRFTYNLERELRDVWRMQVRVGGGKRSLTSDFALRACDSVHFVMCACNC